jgi:hypothetical protein
VTEEQNLSKTDPQLRYLRFFLGSGCCFRAVFESLRRATPHDSDGISYPDMGGAFLKGDW